MITDMALSLASMDDIPKLFWLAPAGAIAALITALLFWRSVMSRSEGDEEMVRIAEAVRQGAMAYLKRQYKVVAGVFVLLIAALAIMWQMRLQPGLSMVGVPIAGLLSGLCGWFGMKMATNASARTANAAKQSLNDGLTVAFRAGAVMGMVVVGMALLDVSTWFLVLNTVGEKFGLPNDMRIITTVMLSYGMGASTQALFARVGGGIYTKAADVGADLVGKVEAGIPEDDARNPATIADNVGDNVGDVAGMGADLYESYYGSILATMALGAAAAFTFPAGQVNQAKLAMLFASAPLALAGVGILCSIAGVFVVRAKEDASFAELLKGLHRGVYAASALIVLAAFGVLYGLVGTDYGSIGVSPWGIGMSIVSGLLAGLVIAHATEYYTSYEHPPTQRISNQALTGPATVIISGIAEGMKSTWAALLTVVVAITAAFTFSGGGDNFLMGLYGVGISAVGMLATLGITLATDAYGPIADNAGGNAEMTGQPPHVRQRTDMLDSLGNTTAATGKGFAIGSAALTALALFAAYVQVVQGQLTVQAESSQASHAYAGTAPEGAHAIYQGHGRFALVMPRGDRDEVVIDCGLLDWAQASDMDVDHLERGMVLGLEPVEHQHDAAGHVDSEAESHNPGWLRLINGRRLVVAGHVDHGDHPHEFEFEVFAARNADVQDVIRFYDVTLMNPRTLGGLFIGVMITFLFCALTMSAVGRAANAMMQECRRQFGKMREGFRKMGLRPEQIEDPEQWPKRVEYEGKEYPDYAECVTISTAGAQREMVVPALLAILAPIGVGLLLDVPGVMGMLAGGLTAGFAVAVYMANAGGAWDNAKKLIESYGRITAEEFANDPAKHEAVPAQIRDAIDMRAQELVAAGKGKTIVYGKGSEMHKATVVGDTVGDPFKDTSGPSLNILIKLISIVSVVFAGLVVKYGPYLGELLGLH